MNKTCANCRHVAVRYFEKITIGFCMYYKKRKNKLPFWSWRQCSMIDLQAEGMDCATWQKKP